MKTFIIREPKDSEILECIKVLLFSFKRASSIDLKGEVKVWNDLIKENIAKYLIAIENDKIIGIGGIFLFQNVASIGHMAILPEYQRQGIGTKIFKKLMKIATDSGYKTVMLYASRLGKPIYKRFGFQGIFYANSYSFPKKIPKLINTNNSVKILKDIPEWLLSLDKETIGFDRSKYLREKVILGAKLLVIENSGYGLISKIMSNLRLGPLISNDLDSAYEITKKGLSLGVDNIIIPNLPYLQDKLLELLQITKNKEGVDLKMIYGQKISEKLENLYGIGTFAKG